MLLGAANLCTQITGVAIFNIIYGEQSQHTWLMIAIDLQSWFFFGRVSALEIQLAT